MTSRTSPAELRRQILVESGHRCAIPTCRQTQIEVHHITPYEKCKNHEFHNLIALCPNCHTRVHAGEIDRKSLLQYKSLLSINSSSIVDHSTVESGEINLNRKKGKLHIVNLAGDVSISVCGWLNEIDSLVLKILNADKHTIKWVGFDYLPFGDGYCFDDSGKAVIEVAYYSGEVIFKPITGHYWLRDAEA